MTCQVLSQVSDVGSSLSRRKEKSGGGVWPLHSWMQIPLWGLILDISSPWKQLSQRSSIRHRILTVVCQALHWYVWYQSTWPQQPRNPVPFLEDAHPVSLCLCPTSPPVDILPTDPSQMALTGSLSLPLNPTKSFFMTWMMPLTSRTICVLSSLILFSSLDLELLEGQDYCLVNSRFLGHRKGLCQGSRAWRQGLN